MRWLAGCLAGWLAALMADWLAGWMAWLAGLDGWLELEILAQPASQPEKGGRGGMRWLAGCLAAWQAGWLP